MIAVRSFGVVSVIAVVLVSAACTTPKSGHATHSGGTAHPTIALQSCAGREHGRLSAGEAAQIINRVRVMAPAQVQSTDACPGGPVLIGLTPGNEHLAHQLLAEYGRKIAVTVGLTAYDGSPGRSPRCGRLPPSARLPIGVDLALRLNHNSVRSGATFSGVVLVGDHGPGSFMMDTGQPLVAIVLRSGTLQVVAIYSGLIAGGGGGPHLRAGETSMIPVVGGTARCDGGVGSALPPGTYQAVVRVAPEGPPHSPVYLTPPVAIRVTA